MGVRTALGMAESAGIPAAGKAIDQFLKPAERAIGNAMNQAGVSLGLIAAPPLALWMAGQYGWRYALPRDWRVGLGVDPAMEPRGALVPAGACAQGQSRRQHGPAARSASLGLRRGQRADHVRLLALVELDHFLLHRCAAPAARDDIALRARGLHVCRSRRIRGRMAFGAADRAWNRAANRAAPRVHRRRSALAGHRRHSRGAHARHGPPPRSR